jgi:hypothetical protein
MSTSNFNQRCEVCNSLIIYDLARREEDGKCIPLDLNGKLHFCSSADKILHECRTVERIKKIIDVSNSVDLSNFQLELGICDQGKNNAS